MICEKVVALRTMETRTVGEIQPPEAWETSVPFLNPLGTGHNPVSDPFLVRGPVMLGLTVRDVFLMAGHIKGLGTRPDLPLTS